MIHVRTVKLHSKLQLTFQSVIYKEWFNDTARFILRCFQGLTHHTNDTLSIHCPICKKGINRVIQNTGLFISPSGISELDCATNKTDTAERSISISRESLQVFFVLGALAYYQVPPLGGSCDEKWCSQ